MLFLRPWTLCCLAQSQPRIVGSGVEMEAVPEWGTANQSYGIGYHDHARRSAAETQPIAGLSAFEAAYAQAANDFPRFERQMIKSIFDKDVLAGTKKPHPELLKRYPNREIPHEDDPYARTLRTPSNQSTRSRQSEASRRSQGSRRSAPSVAGSSIASSVLTAPPSGYYRQLRTPNLMYLTSNSSIGAGGRVVAEPQPGREVWMAGRGGGQQSSFDSCLVYKGSQVPWCDQSK
ncbi:unnamed protein product [Durusdinium trenchii]|uniref:Uncharacterized protein n=1 Tax=Durusdinium trenchii TaxID=1381693 RepID=A0ABP0KHA5_9DINO